MIRPPTVEEIDRELARRRLKYFVQQAWSVVDPAPLIWNWHIEAICDHLEAVTDGRIKRLVINIPPGHLKSLLVAVFWPAWIWLRNPGWRAIFSSYAHDLAVRDSVKCRTLIESEWYRGFNPGWGLSDDQNRKDFFQNSRFGGRMALSVGGKVTGFRGDCIVVDDPLNATDATSKLARDAAIEWWDQAMASRLNDMRTGAKVIIMQRLHEEDLAGHALEQGGYEHLCLPSEFDPDERASTSIGWQDPRSVPGELLFPVMFPAEVLKALKRELGSTAYAGQYQQRPQAAEGGMFKRADWRLWRPAGVEPWWKCLSQRPKGMTDLAAVPLPSRFDKLVGSWDCTFKDTKSADLVAGGHIACVGANFYVLPRLFWKRASFTETLEGVRDFTSARVGLNAFVPVRKQFIEDKANGSAVIDTLKGEVPGIVAVNPEGGKESRAAAIQPSQEAGQIYLPDGVEWLQDWVEQFAGFPRGKHDDAVDMLSQALIRIMPKRTSFAARFRESVKGAEKTTRGPFIT